MQALQVDAFAILALDDRATQAAQPARAWQAPTLIGFEGTSIVPSYVFFDNRIRMRVKFVWFPCEL